ncbi:Sensor histidine kinase YehU [compost metagenome]
MNLIAWKKLNSIKVKLALIILGLLITFMSVTIMLWYRNASQDAERESARSITAMIEVSNASMENMIKDIDKIVAYVSVDTGNYMNSLVMNYLSGQNIDNADDYIRTEREIQNYLVNLSVFKSYLVGLTLSDFNNNTISYGITTSTYDEIRETSWYQQLKSGETPTDADKPILVAPSAPSAGATASGASADTVLSIVRPVKGTGTVLGFVKADIEYKSIGSFFEPTKLNNGFLMILDKSTNQLIWNSFADEGTESFSRMAATLPKGNGSMYVEVQDQPFFVVYNTSEFTNWSTVVFIPKSNLLAHSMQTRDLMLRISLLFCIAAVLIIFFVATLATKNLLRLRDALMQVDEDSLRVPLQIRSRDEIGQLYLQFNMMKKRIVLLIDEVKETERQKRRAEIKALQAQINPHFMHNTLNTIRFLAILDGADHIKSVAESLSNLMHGQMDGRTFVTITEEMEYLKSYLNIQSYRYTDKFDYHIELEEGTHDLMIPKMLLQPIVENALLHGISPLKGKGIVQIKVYTDDEEQQLYIRIQDNGAGMGKEQINQLLDSSAKNNSEHIGISNSQARIQSLFGQNYGLSIWSEPHRFTAVEMRLPQLRGKDIMPYV